MGILTLETSKYELKLDNFEGPLDLLCHLIDKEKLDIYDVKISDIADQYIDYINQMEEMNLEIASEFLVMASTLVYLKSKELLPKEAEDEAELTEEELIKRIIEYKKYKEISKKFKEFYLENSKRAYGVPEEIELPTQKLEKKYSHLELSKRYERMMNALETKMNQNAKNIEKIAIVEQFTVASKVKDMFRALIKHKSFVFNKLFSLNEKSRPEVVTAFSGLLELSRRNKVYTDQREIFGDILVKKRSFGKKDNDE